MARQIVQPMTNSLGLNESTGMISLGTATAQRSQTFTIAAWIKMPIGGSSRTIYSGGASDISFRINATGFPTLVQTAVATRGTSTTQIPNSTWVHVAVTYSNPNITFYVNGELAGTASSATTFTLGSRWIGYTDDPSPSFQFRLRGLIKNVAVANSAFTRTQIQSLMNGEVAGTLTGYYLFNTGSGTTATDSSSSAINGTITGGTWSTDVPSQTRTVSSNRVAVQDFKSSLSFNGTTSKVVLTQASGLPIFSQSGYSVVGRFLVSRSSAAGADIALYSEANSGTNNPTFHIDYKTAISGKQLTVTVRNDANVAQLATVLSTTLSEKQVWHDFVWTDNNGTCVLYINGVADATNFNYTPAGTYMLDRSSIGVVERGTPTNYFAGSLADFRLFSRVLTASEAMAFHNGQGISESGLKGSYLLGEGAGTTAYDTSGNGNNGTITSGTYTSDVPSQRRQLVGGNLVINGDMTYYPPTYSTATTTTARYINGAIAGSTTDSLYRYGLTTFVGSGSAAFDPTTTINSKPSISLTVNASGRATIAYGYRTNGSVSAPHSLIPVLPSTSYTFTYWLKTSDAATNSVCGGWRFYSGDLSAGTETLSSTKLSGTNDWTMVTDTITTASTTRFLLLQARHDVAGNAATLWWGDVSLTPTTPTVRSLA